MASDVQHQYRSDAGLEKDVRTALVQALGELSYGDLAREKLAQMLTEALIERNAIGTESGYAAGLRTAIDALDTVQIPAWITYVSPDWFKDFEAVRELLQKLAKITLERDYLAANDATDILARRKALADFR